MNIKENIGDRITKARKELGITIKELASRTENLSAARISNWEQGTRSPGPMEAKKIANVLNVSASYLLCLTDNPQGETSLRPGNTFRSIPILSMKDLFQIKELQETDNALLQKETKTVIMDCFNKSSANAFLFAALVEDTSMQPDLSQGDLIIVERDRDVCPGDLVLVHLTEKKQIVLRKYGETESCLFQLLASNSLWATTYVKNRNEALIIGVVTEYRRYL